jgi:uncharacterized surface protein with fasciclin (FAS1) repeats
MLSVLILSVLFLQACNDDNDHHAENAIDEVTKKTIVDVAVNNGNFTTLVVALQATGLDVILSDTEKRFTVFAPTDAAFALLGQAKIDELLADTDTLSNILTYHVIGSEVDSSTAISLAGNTVEMLSGDNAGLALQADNLLINTATVITADIQTDNGIIHVIDAVLLPPAEMTETTLNIVETAIQSGNFGTLVSVLQATNLDTILSDEGETFTVFAPTDEAFAMLDPGTIDILLANPDVLTSILLQHVIPGVAVDSVVAYSLSGTMLDTATATAVEIKINTMTDMLMFGGANIVMKDIYTTNGVIHVIDVVIIGDITIPKPSMNLVDIANENGNFTILLSALESTGLDTTLANLENNYTVFAPTDAAFEKLPEGILEGLTTAQLTNILLYHVLPSAVLADKAVTLAQSMNNMAEMVNGDKVALSFTDSVFFINGAKIRNSNVLAGNGVIHVIDNVILPPVVDDAPTQNIVEVAIADPDNFSTLVAVLTTAELVETLSDENTKFTVFAPTNNAFAAIPENVLSALLADTDALRNVLLNHVISEVELTALDAYAANGKMLTTTSGVNVDITINANTGMLMISGANIIISDIYTTNGIIHVIDAVILE